jgi:hypothetical protein
VPRFKLIVRVVLVGLATSATAGSAAQAGPADGVPAQTVENCGVTSYEPLPASVERGQCARLMTGARAPR